MNETPVIEENKKKQATKCTGAHIRAVRDAYNAIYGKWKLHIIASLFFGKKHFNKLESEIPKITPRMLSKELKDLEANGIIERTVCDAGLVKVEYELTESGRSLKKVMEVMAEWGLKHREITIGEKE